MLRKAAITFTLSVLCFVCIAQENILSDRWGENTAFVKLKGKWESGLVQSLRYGVSDKVEFRTNALLMPLLPNAGIKILYSARNDYYLSGEHSISYPTLFLKAVSFKGTGGLISPQYDFPFILSVDNSLLVTHPVGTSSLLTLRAGVCFAIHGSTPDYQSTIDLPLIYPRMAHYYKGASLRGGLFYKGLISHKLYWEAGARIFSITRDRDNLFAENSGTLMWAVSRSLRIRGGYILAWGKYPFGEQIQLWPTIDLIFGSKL
ncbi:MAG: hypothetical protein Q8909_14050 [Bacteroidota bacterium]|nr:hypothetical protein [Bacteroidota bacterium]